MVLPPKPEPVVWVVGTDNSPHAKHALDTTLALMGNGDVLYVFCATAIPSQPASVSWADKTINRQPASQPASQPAPAGTSFSLETAVVLPFACVFVRSVSSVFWCRFGLSQLTTTTTNNRRGQV